MRMPHERRKIAWTFEALISICAGTLGFTFFGLGVMFIRHRLKKHKWRREKLQLMVKNAKEKDHHDLSISTVSDITSFQKKGFYAI
ncbi:hypothetical protein Hanom_Chr01g00056521 [Helianthus anomalus]